MKHLLSQAAILISSVVSTLETTSFITVQQSGFDDQWNTGDDRVMGGQSYSYTNYDSNGYGKFYGTAVGEGGGFSLVYYRPKEGEVLSASDWDGVAVTVSSKDNYIYRVGLRDKVNRWIGVAFEKDFEVKAGLSDFQTIYIPFDDFYATWRGSSIWWYNYFNSLDVSDLNGFYIMYSKFDYINLIPPFIHNNPKWAEGEFEMHFKDVQLYKNL